MRVKTYPAGSDEVGVKFEGLLTVVCNSAYIDHNDRLVLTFEDRRDSVFLQCKEPLFELINSIQLTAKTGKKCTLTLGIDMTEGFTNEY